jgi:superfamily II DNA/RNA helicase
MLLSLPACFSATSGRDGRDGKDGESITIYQIYEETKSIEGNESLTFDEFLREYLSYNKPFADGGCIGNIKILIHNHIFVHRHKRFDKEYDIQSV